MHSKEAEAAIYEQFTKVIGVAAQRKHAVANQTTRSKRKGRVLLHVGAEMEKRA